MELIIDWFCVFVICTVFGVPAWSIYRGGDAGRS